MSRRVCKGDTNDKLSSRLHQVLRVGMQASESSERIRERDLEEVDTDEEAEEGQPGSHAYREITRKRIRERQIEEKNEYKRVASETDRNGPRSMQMLPDEWFISNIENDIFNIISHARENDWNYPSKKSQPLTRERILSHLATNGFHHQGGHHKDEHPMIFNLSGNSWPYGSPDMLKKWTEYAEKHLFDIKGGRPDKYGNSTGYKYVKDGLILIRRNNTTYRGRILFLLPFKAKIEIKGPNEEEWRQFKRNPETGNWDLPIYIDNTVDWEWVTVDTYARVA